MGNSLSFPAPGISMPARRQVKRIGPLGVIVLLHLGLFYALQSGLPRPAKQVVASREVVATFVTPEPAPEPAKPQPAAPKTVPVVKKQVAPPRPKPPVADPASSPNAITAPPVPTVQTEPSPPAAAAAPAPSAPPAPPAPALPRTISSSIEYIQPPQPEYPPVAKRMGEEGKVLLRILVNEKGRPERVEIQKSSGSPRLDEAGRQAVLRAVFKPFMEDGKAVVAYAIVPIKFQLEN